MADDVARLVAVLEANIKGFTKGMDQAQKIADRRFGQIERRLRQTESVFGGFGKRISGFLLGGAAIASITRFVSAVGDMAGKIQDTSDALGVGTDSLQTWQAGALQAGVRQEQFNKALEGFANRLGEAQLKGGAFKKFLDGLGVGTKGNVEQVFFRLADAVKDTSDQSQRAAIVAEAFGAKQVKLTSFIQQGSTAIQAQGVELARTGGIMSREAIAKIDELGDKWEELKRRFTVLGGNVLGGFADEFSQFADELTDPEFQEGLKNLGTLLADIVILTGKLAAGVGNLAGLFLPQGDEISQLRDLIKEFKAANFAVGSVGAKELEAAEKRLRELLRKSAERAGLGPDFKIPTGAPGGIDRTGQLNTDAENAKTLVDQSRADLEAARADLIRSSGESAAAIEQNLARRYEIERDNIVANTDAVIRAAEEKKDAEITALEVQLQQGKINAEQFNQIRINKELEFDAKRAELIEKQRADTAKLYDAEFERALELSRKLEDLRRDAQENRAEEERRAQASRAELEIAREQANTGIFDPGGDSEALLDLRRRQIEETAALEEQEIQDRLQRNLESLEREKDDLEAKGEAWADYEQARVDATAAAEAEIEQIRNHRAEEIVVIDEKANKQREDNLRDSLSTIAGLTRSSNSTLRALGKAAAIVQATMDGIVAVNKALTAAPPPFNFALAALVGTAVAANIAEIAGMEHGGRVTAGTPYVVGEKRPELFVPDTNGRILPRVPNAASPNGVTGGSITINAPIDARGAQMGVADQIEIAMARTLKTVERQFPRLMIKAQRDNL